MLSSVEKKVCERITKLEDEAIGLLSNMIAIDTSDPPGKNNREFVQFLSAYLSSVPMDVKIIEAPCNSLPRDLTTGLVLDRPNIVARIASQDQSSPGLHLNGHYDVVPATGEWRKNPFKAEISKGKIYGRGCADMKGGIAAMVIAARAIQDEKIKLSRTLSFSFVPDEECSGPHGTQFLLDTKSIQANYCIVGEPSNSTGFFNGQKGALWIELNTYGRAAHASSPWKGINAFDLMLEAIALINSKIKPRLLYESNVRIKDSTINSRSTISLGGRVTTGNSVNMVPSHCSVTVCCRLAPNDDMDKLLSDVEIVFKEAQNRNSLFKGDIKVLLAYNACVTPLTSPIVKELKGITSSICAREPEISLMRTGSDLRFFHEAGIPAVIYGPGNLSMAHQANEAIELKQIIKAAQVYALTALRLCSA